MAWTLVKEQGTKASSGSTAGSGTVTGEKTATRVFVAVSDTPTTTVAAESASAGGTTIPSEGQAHPDDPGRRVKSRSAVPDPGSDRKVFFVTVTYSNKLEGDLAGVENPLDRPDVVSFEGTSETEKFFLSEDEDDPKPVVTSAGEVFDEFQERTTGVFKVVIEGNRASLDASLAAEYLKPNAVNSDNVTVRGLTIGRETGKMSLITATPQTENNVTFLRVRWEIDVAPTWDLEIEDRGYHEKDSANAGKLREIANGTPPVKVDKPWPLNGKGNAMPAATDAPAVLTFKRYPRKPFSVWDWTR